MRLSDGAPRSCYGPHVLRGLGVVLSVALVATAVAVAAAPQNMAKDLKAFKRARRAYDALPAAAKQLAPTVTASRRVATAVDAKKRRYYVYVTLMKNDTACVVLIPGKSFTSHCTPTRLLFERGLRETTSVANGLIGGVAENDIKKIVLTGGGKRKTIPLSTDNGYLFGCPAPGTCAKWVRQVVGYNAAGKLVSREDVQ